MPFGWGANPNVVSNLEGRHPGAKSPMPFGWGANPNDARAAQLAEAARLVTNAFRLGG